MKYSSIIAAFILLLAASCTKEITLPQPDYVGKASIQGILEPDSLPLVYFNRTTPFLSATTTTGDLVIRNAVVKVMGNNTTDVLKLDSLYDRINCQFDYFYKGSIKTILNTDYRLEITSSGVFYNATANTKLSKTVVDSVRYTKTFTDVYGEHEGVIVYFKDIANEMNYYRYEQFRPVDTSMQHVNLALSIAKSCIGKDTINVFEQGRSVYNDANTDGLQQKIVVEPAYTHREGLETTVKMQTIDKAMYDFYDQIDKQKLAQYNPFVEPIFLRDGQFGSKAIGFFGCRIRSTAVPFIFPE